MSMERQEEIDRLKSRLHWESGGPLAHLANCGWVRESGEGGRLSAC
jgi:hypothetical protein